MKRLMMILVAMVTLAGSLAHAFTTGPIESIDNKGKDFIFTFLPGSGQGTAELRLTSDVATNVTVHYPVSSPFFTTTVAVVPGNITVVTLPATARHWEPNTVANNAVRAFAPDEFVAYTVANNRSFVSSGAAALGLPVDAMNTEYLIMDFDYRVFVLVWSQFNVFAEFDNTTVTITPKTAMAGRAAGVPFTVVLQRGQGYYAMSNIVDPRSLTGTIISADRPVGVTNGAEACSQFLDRYVFCEHLYEVAQPVQSWGTQVLVTEDLPNRPRRYRILASQDGTTVTQDGVFFASLDRTQYVNTAEISGSHIFSANKPIFVAKFLTDGSGKPVAMGNMIPTEQYLRSYTFSTAEIVDERQTDHAVSIIAKITDVTGGTLLLDGIPIPAGAFTPIGTSGFSSTTQVLTHGTHTTSSSRGGHGVMVRGINAFGQNLYPGGVLFQSLPPTAPISDANPPIVETLMTIPGSPSTWMATDNRPSEDTNSNGMLDPGEDLNGNGLIDKDSGLFSITLEPGATNLTLGTAPYIPGAGSVNFTVSLTNPSSSGSGTVRVTDAAGNVTLKPIRLDASTVIKCDANGDGVITRADINIIFAARGQRATGPNDPRDANNDGVINVRDVRICALELPSPRPPGQPEP